MLIIVYAKKEKHDNRRRQKLVFECAHCGSIFKDISASFFDSNLFKFARDKDKALLKFVTILNDMGNEATRNSSNFDSLRDLLCLCKE